MKNIPVRHIETSQNEATFKGHFRIRNVSELLEGRDLFQELHKHNFYFVLALQKGSGKHEIDFTNYNIADNSVFILRPGQVHQLELKKRCTGFLMAFDTTFYRPRDKFSSQRLNKASHKNFCELEGHSFKNLISILTYIFNEYNSKHEGYAEIIRANLEIFFIELIRHSRTPHTSSEKSSSYAQERYEHFIELMNNRISDLKQISQYAELLNLSPYQLNAVTKQTVGRSASELINEQIILEAKRYLLATPSQVKDIASHLGYEDFSYFIRFFKKHTGYSPEAFRKNYQ